MVKSIEEINYWIYNSYGPIICSDVLQVVKMVKRKDMYEFMESLGRQMENKRQLLFQMNGHTLVNQYGKE